MKKFLSLLILVSILTFVSHTNQAQAAQQTHKITRTITKITYSTIDHTYYAYTNKDVDGGFWVLSIDPDGLTLKQAKKRYIGHTAVITYTGDEQTDEEVEIVNVDIK